MQSDQNWVWWCRTVWGLPRWKPSVGTVSGWGEGARPAGSVAWRRPAHGVTWRTLEQKSRHVKPESLMVLLSWDGALDLHVWLVTHHVAAGVAGVLQVVVEQLGGAILEGFGQGSQQHGELWRVQLEQRDQNHLGRLRAEQQNQSRNTKGRKRSVSSPGFRGTSRWHFKIRELWWNAANTSFQNSETRKPTVRRLSGGLRPHIIL